MSLKSRPSPLPHSTRSDAAQTGFKAQLCCLLAVCLWTGRLISPYPGFSACKMQIITK